VFAMYILISLCLDSEYSQLTLTRKASTLAFPGSPIATVQAVLLDWWPKDLDFLLQFSQQNTSAYK